ncbi:hypothetical protein ACSBR2_012851 [Camellia fascicularis]
MTDELRNFLELTLLKVKDGKKPKFTLGPGDLEKAQLGLGHSYSRAKVKFNVNRVDNMVIQRMVLLAFS